MTRPPAAPQPADPLAALDARNFHDGTGGATFMVVRNRDALARIDPGRPGTVAILGTGRSGTTMTAGVAMLLGLEMGDRLNPRLGDEDLTAPFRAMRASPLRWRLLTLRRDVGRVIRARTARWGRWGFKSPDFTLFYPLLAALLPNAVLIVPVRDVAATAPGYTEHVRGSWRRSLVTLGLITPLLTWIAALTKRPVLVVSYEGAKAKPEAFVDALAAFLALSPTPEARAQAVAYIRPDPGYRPITRMLGHVEEWGADGIRGWVVDVNDRAAPVRLALTLDGETLAEATADRPRDDVRDAGHHPTGRCGYEMRFDPPLAADLSRARLEAPEAGHVVHDPAAPVPR